MLHIEYYVVSTVLYTEYYIVCTVLYTEYYLVSTEFTQNSEAFVRECRPAIIVVRGTTIKSSFRRRITPRRRHDIIMVVIRETKPAVAVGY